MSSDADPPPPPAPPTGPPAGTSAAADRPRAHVEVIAAGLWRLVTREAARDGGPLRTVAGSAAGLVEAAERTLAGLTAELAGAAEDASAAASSAARRAVEGSRVVVDPLLAPLLQRVRAGGRLREDLVGLFTSVLTRVAPDPPTPADDTDHEPGGLTEDGEPDGHQAGVRTDGVDAPVAVAAIGEAISDGIRRAADAGLVQPGRPAEVVGWALTSLLMTLMMRSREGEDVDTLVATAVAAMEELLPGLDDPA